MNKNVTKVLIIITGKKIVIKITVRIEIMNSCRKETSFLSTKYASANENLKNTVFNRHWTQATVW